MNFQLDLSNLNLGNGSQSSYQQSSAAHQPNYQQDPTTGYQTNAGYQPNYQQDPTTSYQTNAGYQTQQLNYQTNPATGDHLQYLNTANSYQKVEQREHVLLRPGTYIGSVHQELRERERILDMTDINQIKFNYANISIPTGLERLFLEILSNASDVGVESRAQGFDIGKIEIKMNNKTISIKNGGKPIPIQKHSTGLWVPELIFGVLLTSGNYDPNKVRTGAGLNGLGAKLTNVYSTRFHIDIGDPYNGLRYRQTWENNMTIKHDPIIESYQGPAYVYVEYDVEFPRFGFNQYVDESTGNMVQTPGYTEYPQEAYGFFARHAADIAYCCKIPVVFNDIPLMADDVYTYAMWMGNYNENCIIHYEWPAGTPLKIKKIGKKMIEYTTDDRILPTVELCILDTPFAGSITAYVNCMMTPGGGVHVEAAQKAIVDKVLGIVNRTETKKAKEKAKDVSKKLKLNAGDVKQHLTIILSCHLQNPEYVGGNTKDKLGAPKPRINISEKVLKQVNDWNLVVKLTEYLNLKQMNTVRGKNKKNVDAYKGIDAHFAGDAHKSAECSLFIVEGDSAKKFAVSLISNIPNGRDYYGVFPLRGKMLNVQRASIQQYYSNKEIEAVREYLNAREGIDYRDPAQKATLRYGKIITLTDADEDGEHIKGLFYNYIFHKLNTLLYISGFLSHFRTPILKAIKGNNYLKFYSLLDFKTWMGSMNNEVKGWRFKYYKGLGTFQKNEAVEEIENPLLTNYFYDEYAPQYFYMAFAKKFEDERKKWIIDYKPFDGIEKYPQLPLSSFIQYELVRYSVSNVERSIPSIRDGFKPSQRKVIYVSAEKWKAKIGSPMAPELKVEGFAGKVSYKTNYTHGEDSLKGTIVTLANNFTGSNNLGLLYPGGQFGNRYDPSPAAPRYLFTRPNYIWPYLFRDEDKELLVQIYDEDKYIEPEYFLPIVPPQLMNGGRGIGSGFSTFIPNYNPIDIATWIICRLMNQPTQPLIPWYRGFNGTIEVIDRTKKSDNETTEQTAQVDNQFTGNEESQENQEILTMAQMFPDSVIENMNDVKKAKKEEEYVDPLGLDEIGFSGKSKSYLAMMTKGSFYVEGNKVFVTELPIGPSFEAYEEWLKKLRSNKGKKTTKKDKEEGTTPSIMRIKDFRTTGTDTNPVFIIEGFKNPTLKNLRLIKSYSLGNMVMLDENNKPKRFATPEAILEYWLQWRFPFYGKRKQLQIKKINDVIVKMNYELRFILSVIDGSVRGYVQGETVILMKKRKDEVLPQMYAIGIPHDHALDLFKKTKLSQCTYEKIEKLRMTIQKKEVERATIEQTSEVTLMINDLTDFIHMCQKHDHYTNQFEAKTKNKKTDE